MNALRALDYARQIAEGLDTAYKHGVVHRDIKPQNIVINSKDEVKIPDFGLPRSRETVTLTQSNVFMGTADYIPPEQAQSAPTPHTPSALSSIPPFLFKLPPPLPPSQQYTP